MAGSADKRPSGLRLRAERLAQPLPPLLVAAERVAATVAQGVHGRRRVGTGETFWQYRVYEPGDAASAIDWRQSAKRQRFYVRQHEWEAAESVWLWRDASASMAYRSGAGWPEKSARATLLALAIAALLLRGGEWVALLDGDMRPAAGRSALERLAAVLARAETAAPSLPAVQAMPRFARTIWIGDFLAPVGDLARVLRAYAAQGVVGHLLQVLDPAEEDLPFAGRVRFEGPEGEGSYLAGRAESLRDDYRAALARLRAAIGDLCRAAGWSFAVHRTDRPAAAALLALYGVLSGYRGGPG